MTLKRIRCENASPIKRSVIFIDAWSEYKDGSKANEELYGILCDENDNYNSMNIYSKDDYMFMSLRVWTL